jgi:hypothetical protein
MKDFIDVVKRVALNERIVVTHRVVACIGCLLKLLLQGIKLHMEEVC